MKTTKVEHYRLHLWLGPGIDMMIANNKHGMNEMGFVLPTALLLLTLLTMLATTMFYVSRSSMVTSSAANSSTVATYYAETAIHYMSWALANDAEFDSATYTGSYVRAAATEPIIPTNALQVGDNLELMNYLWDPGPTGVAGASASDSVTAYNTGQVLYFDNSPMGTRHLCLESAVSFPNCIDVTLKKKKRVEPTMYQISTKLPRYIKLDIAAGDSSVTPSIPPSITASIPSLPHRNPPQVENKQLANGTYDHNGDVPENGAVVWITAADPNTNNPDIELFALDPRAAYGGVDARRCNVVLNDGGAALACPCTAPVELAGGNRDPLGPAYQPDPADPQYISFMAAQACDANTGQWLPSYNIVAYAIGYVNGKPSHMLRAIIK